ncbi:hypothetical protein ACN20G_36880 (plasmid) [Streptomyces sp. BI20]|uniref:hypothetical protein n=1 Tax=Streptomyces sp. BI20 TaxID=3403460 RepID=UPI003C737AFD
MLLRTYRHQRLLAIVIDLVRTRETRELGSASELTPAHVQAIVFARQGRRIHEDLAADYLRAALMVRGRHELVGPFPTQD